MKCLLVISHPLSNSLCRSLTDRVTKELTEYGHQIVEEDLYANKFEPALTAEERQSYYGVYDSSHIDEQVKRLLEAEALILLFPTWWFGFPAMLKGWFDRVWGPGIAYDHANDFGPVKPRLNNLKKVLVITTLGSPWWVDRLIMWQPVKRTLKLALLGACARKAKLEFLTLYKSEKLREGDLEKFSKKLVRVLSKWR